MTFFTYMVDVVCPGDTVILPRHGGVGLVSQYKPHGEHGLHHCIQCVRHPRLENMPG